jgi:AraC-like DNA-binding protein
MRVIQFTIPVAKENSIVVQEDKIPHFYNHLHRHNETQVTWVMHGEGTLIAGNYMHPFKPGDIYIMGANQPHIFKSDPAYFDKRRKKYVHALTFFFNPESLSQTILNLPEAKSIRKFLENTHYGLQAPEDAHKRIVKEMLNVKNSKQGFRLAGFIHMLQSLADIRNWKILASATSQYSFSESEGLRMNDVYQYTMSHYSNNIRLREIADVAHLTPQAFCRYFKKHTRKTYINFVNEIRISEACKKILSGDFDSISSVAYDVGFSSSVSFNRVFKRVTGNSPRQYLKEFKHQVD